MKRNENMNRLSLEEFLNDPEVKATREREGSRGLARLAIMAGNLSKNEDLRTLGGKLLDSDRG
jgi:hypothetical protein